EVSVATLTRGYSDGTRGHRNRDRAGREIKGRRMLRFFYPLRQIRCCAMCCGPRLLES
ncbi:hypothetical protein V5799_019409, partial [Amblyomma americanum]